MRTRTLLAAAAANLLILFAGACSSTPPNSWVGSNEIYVIMVQFTQASEGIQGTLDYAQLKQDGQREVRTEHRGFTGSIDAGRITLTFSQGLGFTSSVSGSVSRRELMLSFPDSVTGGLVQVRLRPGEVSEYTEGVEALRITAGENADHAAEVKRSAAADKRLQGLNDAIEGDFNELEKALSSAPEFSQFEHDLKAARQELASARTAAGKAADAGKNSDGCYEAGNARYHAGSIEYHANAIDFAAQRVQGKVDAVNRLSARLDTDSRALIAELAARGELMDAANSNALRELQERAAKTVTSWSTSVASYQQQVVTLVKEGNAVADAAEKAFCS
jgi:hypothetical protein